MQLCIAAGQSFNSYAPLESICEATRKEEKEKREQEIENHIEAEGVGARSDGGGWQVKLSARKLKLTPRQGLSRCQRGGRIGGEVGSWAGGGGGMTRGSVDEEALQDKLTVVEGDKDDALQPSLAYWELRCLLKQSEQLGCVHAREEAESVTAGFRSSSCSRRLST